MAGQLPAVPIGRQVPAGRPPPASRNTQDSLLKFFSLFIFYCLFDNATVVTICYGTYFSNVTTLARTLAPWRLYAAQCFPTTTASGRAARIAPPHYNVPQPTPTPCRAAPSQQPIGPYRTWNALNTQRNHPNPSTSC